MEYNGQKVPKMFSICINENCPKANSCLRHNIYKVLSDEQTTLSVVNPAYARKHTNTQCKFYHEDKTEKIAYGFKRWFDDMPLAIAKSIHLEIEAYLGHTYFYLCKKGQRGLRPKEQAHIKAIFNKYGYKETPPYDRIVEEHTFYR